MASTPKKTKIYSRFLLLGICPDAPVYTSANTERKISTGGLGLLFSGMKFGENLLFLGKEKWIYFLGQIFLHYVLGVR